MRSVWGDQMFSATTALQRPYNNLDDTFVVCEKGCNCTVEIKFVAPAYKCQEQARGVGAQIRSLQQESGEAHSPIDFNLLAPIGSYTYISNAGLGHYSNTQLKAVNFGGIPLMNPPFPENLGAFRTDPVVWVGYSEIVDSSVPPFLQENQAFPFNRKAWEPVLVACEHYEADYTVELRYIDGMQPRRIKERKLLSPTINTTFMEGATANDGTDDDTLAVPESNYIFPTDVKRYKRTAAYYAMGSAFRERVDGAIQVDDTGQRPNFGYLEQPAMFANTSAARTMLINPANSFPHPNLVKRLQEYYETFLLSFFGNPRFLVVAWAADPSVKTGNSSGVEYLYPCTRSRPGIKYYHRARILVLVYGIAAWLAILGVVAGTLAARENGGVSRNTRFSSVLAATRNASFADMEWDGRQRDRAYISKDLIWQKLGYGILKSGEGNCSGSRRPEVAEPQYGFGFPGEVDQTPAMRSRRTFVTDEADS